MFDEPLGQVGYQVCHRKISLACFAGLAHLESHLVVAVAFVRHADHGALESGSEVVAELHGHQYIGQFAGNRFAGIGTLLDVYSVLSSIVGLVPSCRFSVESGGRSFDGISTYGQLNGFSPGSAVVRLLYRFTCRVYNLNGNLFRIVLIFCPGLGRFICPYL